MYYDYRSSMREDIREWLRENDFDFIGNDELDCEELCQEMWDDDSVTGNGAFFYDTEDNCLKYIKENLLLVRDVVREMAVDLNKLVEEDHCIQKLDCIIRCYLLDECVMDVIRERKENE